MRFYRISFLGGLGLGYVLGTQAGRERYEQIKQLARKAAEHPAMQQTAGALQAQASATAKMARDKAASTMRMGASRVAKKVPGSGPARGKAGTTSSPSSAVAGNGAMPTKTGGDDQRPFVPVDGDFGEGKPT